MLSRYENFRIYLHHITVFKFIFSALRTIITVGRYNFNIMLYIDLNTIILKFDTKSFGVLFSV